MLLIKCFSSIIFDSCYQRQASLFSNFLGLSPHLKPNLSREEYALRILHIG